MNKVCKLSIIMIVLASISILTSQAENLKKNSDYVSKSQISDIAVHLPDGRMALGVEALIEVLKSGSPLHASASKHQPPNAD